MLRSLSMDAKLSFIFKTNPVRGGICLLDLEGVCVGIGT